MNGIVAKSILIKNSDIKIYNASEVNNDLNLGYIILDKNDVYMNT